MHTKDLFSLTGKVAIVTGGGSGLGWQMTQGLAEAGANIVIASRRYELCRERAGEIEERTGVKAIGVKVDITQEDEVSKMAETVIGEMGRIDILVNNAGIGKVIPVLETSLNDWHRVFSVNVDGTFLCCKAVGKYLIQSRKGKIINIASVYGLAGVDGSVYTGSRDEDFEELSYTASKGALINLTRDLAASWAKHNINVNAIVPGGFKTEADKELWERGLEKRWCARTPLGRVGGEDDLKGAVVFLASDASNYVTGHSLVVDGGWLAW